MMYIYFMNKMIWTNPRNGKKEIVLLIGVNPKSPTSGFSSMTYACIMKSNKYFYTVPVNELSLTDEDYDKIFKNN